MRSDEHVAAARDHARRAAELASWPETRTNGTGSFDDPRAGRLWYRAWDSAADHQRLAASHLSAAGRLQAEYDEACAAAKPAEPRSSPLQRFGVGGAPIADGVMVFLSPDAGTPDQLLAAVRCHRASVMLGASGMDDCPLDLEHIQLRAYGDRDGITVEIKPRDRALVPELQRRAAHDLEIASQRPRATTK